MLIAAILLSALAVASVIMAVVWVRSGWLYGRRRHSIVVHTLDERTFSGVLASTNRDGLVLVDARLVDEGVTVKGDVLVPREQVRFVQVIR